MSEEKQEKTNIIRMPATDSIYTDMDTFANAQRMAQSIAASDLVPPQYQNNVANCLIAIEVATRFSRWNRKPSVLAVMQNLYVVHGKPSFEAKFIIGLINSCGSFSPLRWEKVGKEGTDSFGMRAYATHKETKETLLGTVVDVAQAKAQGWWTKNQSKWPVMTEQMLVYRSAAYWCRQYAPEILMGMSTKDELDDYQEVVVESEVVSDNPNTLDALAEKLTGETNETNQ